MKNRIKDKLKDKNSLKSIIIDFIKFGIVGVINTFTSYLIVNVCHYFYNLHIQLSNFIAFILSVLVSFTLNSIFVFNKKNRNTKEIFMNLLKTYLAYSFTGLFLTAILIQIECKILSIPLYIASLLNLIITVPINFFLNKFWAFRDTEDQNKKLKEDEQLKNMSKKHTFAICAYGESDYLEECIKSVLNQEIKTNYLISTSTPNNWIKQLAEKYNIPYYIRNGKSDIQEDWNFSYNNAKTELVTIAHQDDIYESNYTREILKNYDKNTLLYNTGYNPYKNGNVVVDINSRLKGVLKTFLKNKYISKIKFFKIMSLAFGNSINCPSVTYNKEKLGDSIFTSDLKFALDWDTFLKIAKKDGGMLYIPKKLIKYRIHDKATTKKFILDNRRIVEDQKMFNKFWPKCITNIIMKFYTKSYKIY